MMIVKQLILVEEKAKCLHSLEVQSIEPKIGCNTVIVCLVLYYCMESKNKSSLKCSKTIHNKKAFYFLLIVEQEVVKSDLD